MRRKLVWIEEPYVSGWGCSECAWLPNLYGWPSGNSLAEMMQNYEQQRNRDFATHICAEHPRAEDKKS